MQIHKWVRMKHYLTIFCQHPQWWFIGNISIKIFFNKKLQKNARKSNPLYKRIVGVLIFTIFDVFPVNLKSFQIHLSQLTKAIWMNEWCLLKCQIWLMATDEVYVWISSVGLHNEHRLYVISLKTGLSQTEITKSDSKFYRIAMLLWAKVRFVIKY